MMNREDILLEIKKLDKEVTANIKKISPADYKKYLKTRKGLASKYKNWNSASNRIKRFGAAVKKGENGYIYEGKNLTSEIFLDGCVVDYWTTYNMTAKDKKNQEVIDQEWNDRCGEYETKSELLNFLLMLDEQLEVA